MAVLGDLVLKRLVVVVVMGTVTITVVLKAFLEV
jgi:hypothetical protein